MSALSLTKDDPCLEYNLKGHLNAVNGLSFHPSTTQLGSCSKDRSVGLFNLPPKDSRCNIFKGHSGNVTSVAFSTNGQLLASCSEDCTVRLWVPTSRGGSVSFKAHTSAVQVVTFSPQNTEILTGSNDKSVKLWNVQYRRFLCSFIGHTNWVRCCKFSPDGRIIASCADDKTLRMWDAVSGQYIHTFFMSKGTGKYVDFHRTGDAVAIATSCGSVRVYDIRNNKLQQHYILHDTTTCVLWHPDYNFLFSSGLDGTVKIVDAMEGRPLYTLKGHQDAIHCIAFSKDGDYFATGSSDKHIMVWKTNFITKQVTPLTSLSSLSTSQESV